MPLTPGPKATVDYVSPRRAMRQLPPANRVTSIEEDDRFRTDLIGRQGAGPERRIELEHKRCRKAYGISTVGEKSGENDQLRFQLIRVSISVRAAALVEFIPCPAARAGDARHSVRFARPLPAGDRFGQTQESVDAGTFVWRVGGGLRGRGLAGVPAHIRIIIDITVLSIPSD